MKEKSISKSETQRGTEPRHQPDDMMIRLDDLTPQQNVAGGHRKLIFGGDTRLAGARRRRFPYEA